jgi:hypothetical protein
MDSETWSKLSGGNGYHDRLSSFWREEQQHISNQLTSLLRTDLLSVS